MGPIRLRRPGSWCETDDDLITSQSLLVTKRNSSYLGSDEFGRRYACQY